MGPLITTRMAITLLRGRAYCFSFAKASCARDICGSVLNSSHVIYVSGNLEKTAGSTVCGAAAQADITRTPSAIPTTWVRDMAGRGLVGCCRMTATRTTGGCQAVNPLAHKALSF